MSSAEQIIDTTMESVMVCRQIYAMTHMFAPISIRGEDMGRLEEYLKDFAEEAARFVLSNPPPPPPAFARPEWKEALQDSILNSFRAQGLNLFVSVTLADFAGEFPGCQADAGPFEALARISGTAARMLWYGLDPSYYFERDPSEAEAAYQLHRELKEDDSGVTSGTIYTK